MYHTMIISQEDQASLSAYDRLTRGFDQCIIQ